MIDGLYATAGDIKRDQQAASSRLTILEAGPVRVRIRTELIASFTTQENSSDTKHTEQISYELDYSLVSGEPLLRMVADGQAPSNHTVLTGFTLSGANITSFLHGTPYHWIQTATAPGWAARYNLRPDSDSSNCHN